MIPQIGVTQETMGNIEPNDTKTPKDITKEIYETAYGRLIAYRNTNREARTYSEIRHAVV